MTGSNIACPTQGHQETSIRPRDPPLPIRIPLMRLRYFSVSTAEFQAA